MLKHVHASFGKDTCEWTFFHSNWVKLPRLINVIIGECYRPLDQKPERDLEMRKLSGTCQDGELQLSSYWLGQFVLWSRKTWFLDFKLLCLGTVFVKDRWFWIYNYECKFYWTMHDEMELCQANLTQDPCLTKGQTSSKWDRKMLKGKVKSIISLECKEAV